MPCIEIPGGLACTCAFHKLRLQNGCSVFMHWHCYMGPVFYKDKRMNRQIENWEQHPFIKQVFEWFIGRGCKS